MADFPDWTGNVPKLPLRKPDAGENITEVRKTFINLGPGQDHLIKKAGKDWQMPVNTP